MTTPMGQDPVVPDILKDLGSYPGIPQSASTAPNSTPPNTNIPMPNRLQLILQLLGKMGKGAFPGETEQIKNQNIPDLFLKSQGKFPNQQQQQQPSPINQQLLDLLGPNENMGQYPSGMR